jgi:hypothetical protein
MPWGARVSGIGPPGLYQGGLEGIPSGTPIDAYGYPVPPSSPTYVDYIIWRGGPNPHTVRNPTYNPTPVGTGAGTSTAFVPPSFTITFDTIGQTIYRSIGHCRLPLRMIWAQGIIASGDTTVSPTLTFAAALCAPIDPSEEGQVAVIFNGNTAIYDPSAGGVIAPDGLSVENAAALVASLNAAVVYPGDEAQLPAPLIVADKGASLTNAFRGLRYIIFPLFPLAVNTGTGLSIQWTRTNDLSKSTTYTPAAVEFAAGSG